MRAKGVQWATKLRNVKAVTTFDDFAVEAVDGGSNTFNLKFGIVPKSCVSVGSLSVGGEGGIVVEHCFGGTNVSTTLDVRVVVEGNLRTHGGKSYCGSCVQLRREKTG